MENVNLKTIIEQYPECLSSKAAFKAVLSDCVPTAKREINILTLIFESGIAQRIKNLAQFSESEFYRASRQLENEYGIVPKYSAGAILAWYEAYNIEVSIPSHITEESPPAAYTTIDAQQPFPLVQGKIDDYELEYTYRGWYIKRFQGFEEEKITIPNQIDGKIIIGIGREAFKGCVSVRTISLSRGIMFISNSAFKDCNNITEIVLPDTLVEIGTTSIDKSGEGAFSGTSIGSITIPNSVEFLGARTFACCEKLESVNLSNKITKINDATFSCCKSLTSIQLPSQITEIGENAFYKCEKLKEVHIPVGTQAINISAFEGCKLKEIYVPPTVTKIGYGTNACDTDKYSKTLGEYGVTIYCVAGSKALEFARRNNIKCANAQFN